MSLPGRGLGTPSLRVPSPRPPRRGLFISFEGGSTLR